MGPLDKLTDTVNHFLTRDEKVKDIRVLNYEIVKPELLKNWEIVLKVLNNSKTPLTSDEVSKKCSLTVYQCRRAMSELKKQNKVKEFSQNKINGYWRYLWVVV